MIKKVFLASLVMFGLVFSQTVSECFADIAEAKAQIVSLIESGKFAEANTATDEIIALPASIDKCAALQQIAGAYQNAKQYDKAISVSDYVLQNWPKEGFVVWAGISKAISQLGKGDISSADITTERIIADYADNVDLPQVLSIIADVYLWQNKYDKAERLYVIAIDKSPNGRWSAKARLGLASVTVLRLIESNNYSLAENQTGLLAADFAGNPDLPETLYRIAEKYEWSLGFEEARNVYLQTMKNSPDGPWGVKAKLGAARANVLSFIKSEDYAQARRAVDKLITDFAGTPDLPQSLYFIAERYKWARSLENAKGVYQQILKKYPDSEWVGNAKLGISMADVMSLIIMQDHSRAQTALDKMIADFAGNPELPRAIIVAGEQYYREGLAKESEGLAEQARDCFERAVQIWDGFISKHSDSDLAPEACCWAGDCYNKLGRYNDSIRCFGIVTDRYPNYKYVWHATFMVGRNYESMKDSGLISKSNADPKIKAAYAQLVEKYPTCTSAKIAREWLDSNKSQQGEEK